MECFFCCSLNIEFGCSSGKITKDLTQDCCICRSCVLRLIRNSSLLYSRTLEVFLLLEHEDVWKINVPEEEVFYYYDFITDKILLQKKFNLQLS